MYGRVKDLEYKTIRYPGHMEKVRAMADLGFFDREPRDLDGIDVVPRELSVRLLQEHLSFDEPDVVLLRVSARGKVDGDVHEIRYEMIDNYDESTGLSAMMRTTGFPIAQIAFMIATGEISARGAVPQENCVPVRPFLSGLAEYGLHIERRVIDG
jgi:lysine 6-dehydrogenase